MDLHIRRPLYTRSLDVGGGYMPPTLLNLARNSEKRLHFVGNRRTGGVLFDSAGSIMLSEQEVCCSRVCSRTEATPVPM